MAAVLTAANAVANWWSSSSWLDKLDMAMTIIGVIPGIDVVSDAYFLGRALIDVAQGKGDWGDVAMAAKRYARTDECFGIPQYSSARIERSRSKTSWRIHRPEATRSSIARRAAARFRIPRRWASRTVEGVQRVSTPRIRAKSMATRSSMRRVHFRASASAIASASPRPT